VNYNAAFFGLFENTFKLFKREYGEDIALKHFTELMEQGLSKSYGNDFEKGSPETFKQLVGERDELVGLRVEFPTAASNEIIYRFLDDPFPNLRQEIKSNLLDQCYMNFKVKYILGDEWDYTTNKHLWNGDEYTEHRIYKKQ